MDGRRFVGMYACMHHDAWLHEQHNMFMLSVYLYAIISHQCAV